MRQGLFCVESSEHNGAYIAPPICTKRLMFNKLAKFNFGPVSFSFLEWLITKNFGNYSFKFLQELHVYRSFEKLNQTIVWYSDISTLAKNTRSPLFLGTIACSLRVLRVGINLVSRQLIALVRPHPSLVFLWHKGRNFRAITGDCRLAAPIN